MCGIVGWIDWNNNIKTEHEQIEAMTKTLSWRGPDTASNWLSEHVALGHRRLIVVDPKGGGQPMERFCGDRRYVLIYNGELYNTSEIRLQLQSRGHVFQSHSDTEVLLVSYIEWGRSCVDHLNGIFAFAVWDEYEQKLFAARDRLGVKPLFFSLQNNRLLFASELKALLVHPTIKREIDGNGLSEILFLGPGRTPGHGIFRGVEELKPGFSLTYDRNGLRTNQYWKLQSHEHTDDLETTISRVRELVYDAVERQLVSDVPLCTLLSGGLDSSVITAIASNVYLRNGQENIHTYSVDYVDNDQHFRPNEFQPNSDAAWIKKVSDYLGTFRHTTFIDTPQLVSSLSEAVYARDLPGMADIDSSLYLFSKEIRKDAIVALSGECADEVFGGYPWFYREEALNANTFPWSRNLAERIKLLSPELINELQPERYVAGRYEEALSEVPLLPSEDRQDARIREMFYLNLTRWMPTLLDRKDRMTMRASLEVRVPFCDHRLVEYVWNVPWKMKNIDGREKGLLRSAMKGLLPDDVLWRKKSPYPKTHNPDYLEAVRQHLFDILDEPSSPILPLIDKSFVKALAQNSTTSTHLPWFGQLMNIPQLFAYLYQLNLWLKEYSVTIK